MKKLLVAALIALLPSIAWGAFDSESAYPGALDTATDQCTGNPTGDTTDLCFDATVGQTIYEDYWDAHSDAIIELEKKVGSSAAASVDDTPSDDQTLMGTDTNKTRWTAIGDCDDSVGQHLNYDTTNNAFSCGTSVQSINIADTAFTAGTGIAFSTDDISFSSTELGTLTWYTGANDTAVLWTWNFLTGTDPVFTFQPGIVNLSAGALQEGGVAILNNDEMDASSELLAIFDDETGSASGTPLIVFNQNPTINGAVLNGVLDAGGATSLEIPNDTDLTGTGPTVDTTGEIGIDTDDEQFWAKVSDTTIIKLDGSSCSNGQVLEMNASGVFVCATDDTAGAPILNSIAPPNAASSWTLEDTETVTFTSAASGTNNWLNVINTSATQSGQTYLLNLDHSAANELDTNADFLLCQDADTEVFKIESDGNTTINGTLSVGGGISNNDVNITNVGDIALDSLSADGTNISIVAASGTVAVESVTFTGGALTGITSVNDGIIAAADLATADFGDFSCSAGTCTTDNGSIGVADLASVDFGEFTCNGSACTVDASTILAADMGNSDHGHVSWTTNVATVEDFALNADAVVSDDISIGFGTSSNWTMKYNNDAGTYDDQLLIATTGTASTAITDPMLQVLVGAAVTTNQQVFGVAYGTQASNTDIMTIDKEGDLVVAGSITTNASLDPTIALDVSTATDTDWWVGVNSNGTGTNDDSLEFRTAEIPGTGVQLEAQYDGDWLATGDVYVKGGTLTVGTAGQDGTLVFYNDLATDRTVTFQPSASQDDANFTYTLPINDGASGEVLSTDGSGVLSWAAAGSGDVSSVGPVGATGCIAGACYDGTSDGGQVLLMYDGNSNAVTIDAPDVSGDYTVTLPESAGTLVNCSDAGKTITFSTGGSTDRTYNLADGADVTILTNANVVTVPQGGTGRATGTTAYSLVATGTTATGAQQTLANGATTEILVGGGASALPVWTTATGSGAPVRAATPTLVTPVIGAATGTSLALGADPADTAGTVMLPTGAIIAVEGTDEDTITMTDSTGMAVDLKNASNNTTFSVTNSAATYAADLSVDGGITAASVATTATEDPYVGLPTSDAQDTDWYIGVNADAGATSDDDLEFRYNPSSGTAVLMSIDPQVGIEMLKFGNDNDYITFQLDGDGINIYQVDNGTNNITIGDNNDTLNLGSGGTSTLTINTSDWDIDATGIMTGIGNITSDGNIAGATYGSDSSISNAELLTLDDGATTQILVGGGAGSAPVWGTDIPTAVTIGTAYIYRAGGTDVADADVADNITITAGSQIASGSPSFTAVLPASVGVDDLGSATAEWDDVYLGDNSVIYWGAGQETSLTYDAGAADKLTLDDNLAVTGTLGVTGVLSGVTGTYTGELTGLVDVNVDANGALLIPAADCSGSVFVNTTTANTYELPAAAVGLNCCFLASTTDIVTVEPLVLGNDHIFYGGLALAEDEALLSPATAGSFVCLLAINDTTWQAMGSSGTWTQATPP